jgi:hypothetical protein
MVSKEMLKNNIIRQQNRMEQVKHGLTHQDEDDDDKRDPLTF